MLIFIAFKVAVNCRIRTSIQPAPKLCELLCVFVLNYEHCVSHNICMANDNRKQWTEKG